MSEVVEVLGLVVLSLCLVVAIMLIWTIYKSGGLR